ncbi:MAG: hypothetical protein ACFFAS_02475 [Promethearchaeota archaeon]
MSNTKYTRILVITTILGLIGAIFASSALFSTSNGNDVVDTSLIGVRDFSMDDYEPLFDYTEQLRGNITASAMDFQGLGLGFYLYNAKYPELADDFSSNVLNLSHIDITFINTTNPAFRKDTPSGVVENEYITVLLNETLEVRYNMTGGSEGFLVYCSKLTPTRLVKLEVKKELSSIEEVDANTYRIDENGFIIFDYDQHFIEDILNFSMHLIWEYDLTVNPWILEQVDSEDIALIEQEQSIEPGFNYYFRINGYEHGTSFDQTRLSDEIKVNLTINPPNMGLLRNHTLEINNESKTVSNYLNDDNSFHTDLIPVNLSSDNSFFLTFTSEFNVSFVDPVENAWWSIDRLLELRNIRERTYFPTITSGPSEIYVSNIVFFESTIAYNQCLSSYSLFERPVSVEHTLVEDWIDEPQFTTSNPFETMGLNVTMPNIILGEICPFSIKYNATENLRLKITDNIGMPIIGLQAVIEYHGRPYGTFISQDLSQPISTQTTDIRSEIFIGNVPNGNYTINVYFNGIYQGSFTASSYKDINIVTTNIIHFPIWIIIFGAFSVILLALGFLLYKKNIKKAIK